MPALYEFFCTVVTADIDMLGHANNLSYLRWMQSAALAHSAAQGWPTDAYQKIGAGWVVRSHQIEYLQPAFEGNEIVVRTWVADMKKVTSLRRYSIVRSSADKETILATASTNWAFIHYESGVPRRIPVEVASSFELMPDPA